MKLIHTGKLVPGWRTERGPKVNKPIFLSFSTSWRWGRGKRGRERRLHCEFPEAQMSPASES